MDTTHEGQFGTLLPKTVFNITEKGRTLLGVADGILEHTTNADAEKTIMYLDKQVRLIYPMLISFWLYLTHMILSYQVGYQLLLHCSRDWKGTHVICPWLSYQVPKLRIVRWVCVHLRNA